MFIYNEWEKVCLFVSKNRNSIPVKEIVEQESGKEWVAIKHDVETNVEKALIMARIESKYNIKATYYVQAYLLNSDNIRLLKQIQELGHEVTYHYDVLDANNGNMDKAIEDFKDNINKFNKYGFKIETVCPHGNPVMIRRGWTSNKDFFRDKKVQKLFPNILDIVVQLPKILDDYIYISDAGYSWKLITNVEDNDIINKGDEIITDIFSVLKNNKMIIISTHPHRWEKSKTKFLFNVYLFIVLKKVAKNMYKVPILKQIISKFYYLAKKI